MVVEQFFKIGSRPFGTGFWIGSGLLGTLFRMGVFGI